MRHICGVYTPARATAVLCVTITPVNFVDPSGLAVTVDKDDFDSYFKGDIQSIFGNENLQFEMIDNKNKYTITGVSGEVGENGSKVGSALLSVILGSDKVFELKVSNIPGSNYQDGTLVNYVNGVKWESGIVTLSTSALNDVSLRQSNLIHEMTHAYTNLMGYNQSLQQSLSGGDVVGVVDAYKEATAVTVEEQFRAEMGYASRSAVTNLGIGVNDYGTWPTDALTNPASKYYGATKAISPTLSLMQTRLIGLDIMRTTRGIGR